ncbi:DUF2971 domain-containing protein [Algimonas ampicilliniresistens]|uniref:DUF2971 domain-containing protein n=1 Tax=Algimonas ampicilliniresistens TaxID=1298735 RepID=UPI0024E07CF5|nr:DUF2971 domain-containing protein [Algimonas ampicilliniresistens]
MRLDSQTFKADDPIGALKNVFFPHITARMEEFKKGNFRFVHYTSSENLIEIVKTKELWLRTTRLMNDYHEIERGIAAVTNYFSDNSNAACKEFWEILDACHSGIQEEIKSVYISSLEDLRANTFMASLSAHYDREDFTGRLSMWRAYAPKNGVALILNPEVFYREENRIDVLSYPALYWSDHEIKHNFDSLTVGITNKKNIIETTERMVVVNIIVELFTSFAICLKHPGFEEELELRLVFRPTKQTKNAVKKSIEIIGTAPQIVYKVPLEKRYGTALDDLVNRVIIGPSSAVFEMKTALTEILADAGITDPNNKLYFSEIPLRT